MTCDSIDIYIDDKLLDMYKYSIVVCGDLSGDGDADSLDLLTMMNQIAGKEGF